MSELITLPEVAEMANVSLSAVRRWRQDGTTDIRFARIGRRVMARRTEVQAWIDSHFVT